MAGVRIFLVDDHAVLRSGLKMLIESHPSMTVVGEAGTLAEALDHLGRIEVDVVILDLVMPGVSGLEGVKRVRQTVPGARVIVLTMHDDPAYARAAIALGASGYLVKSIADEELATTIREVSRGGIYVHAGTGVLTRTSASPEAGVDETPYAALSAREREVLQMVALGHTSQAVADRLGVSVKTVESYRSRLMHKLGLSNRADLMRLALAAGLLGKDDKLAD